MIWIFVFIILFALEIALLATTIQDIKRLNDDEKLFVTLSRTEEEKKEIKTKFTFLREMTKSNFLPLIFSILLTGAILVANMFWFRDVSITKYRQGKIWSEDTERVSTRNGEVTKVDTVYTYHVVKKQK